MNSIILSVAPAVNGSKKMSDISSSLRIICCTKYRLAKSKTAILIINLIFCTSFLFTQKPAIAEENHKQGPSQKTVLKKNQVFTEPLKKTKISRLSIYYGRIEPLLSMGVYTPLDAVVEKLLKRVGDTVKKGETIAILQPTGVDQYRNAMRLTAKINGIIQESPYSVGDFITKNSSIMRIYQANGYKCKLHMTQDDLSFTTINQQVPAFFEEDTSTPIEAKITAISPLIDPNLGTQEVTVSIAAQPNLKPGQLIHFRFTLGDKEGFIIASTRVKGSSGNYFLYSIDDDNKVKKISVNVATKNEDQWEIQSPDLKEGMTIISKAAKEPLQVGEEVAVIKRK
ncbi:MAG: HlyD family efflux transporter periplasmic adaptor subunit [Bdellovibrionota bacterium]